MREIKFRAAYKGKLYSVTEILWSDRTVYIWDGAAEDGEVVSLDDVTLLQFTGLKVKNGKEIYEGNVALVGDTKWEVRWDNEDAGFWFFSSAGQKQLFGTVEAARLNIGLTCDEAEIVGNIYENPELLK
jgi:uncharacterized phage protein (TIGR01671 family)